MPESRNSGGENPMQSVGGMQSRRSGSTKRTKKKKKIPEADIGMRESSD
jgi:hypothetical protein